MIIFRAVCFETEVQSQTLPTQAMAIQRKILKGDLHDASVSEIQVILDSMIKFSRVNILSSNEMHYLLHAVMLYVH